MNINDFKICCVHLIGFDNSDYRYKITANSFNKMGILNNVEIYNCVRCKHDDHMIDIYPSLHNGYYDNVSLDNSNLYGNVYNLIRNYYNIIKTNYILGVKYLMLFEDDIIYDKDDKYFTHMINCIPENFDLCKFTLYADQSLTYNDNYNNDWFSLYNKEQDTDNGYLLGTQAWCINRKMMELFINEIDNYPQAADVLLNNICLNNTNMNIYIPNYTFLNLKYFESIINNY